MLNALLGDVFSLRALGKTIIVLNSEKAASELLEKRGAQYSDRPQFPIYERSARTIATTYQASI